MTTNKGQHTYSSRFSDMMREARSGRFGDLRLLGLCTGVFLLCVLGLLLLTPKKPSRALSGPSAGVAAVIQPANPQVISENASQVGSAYNGSEFTSPAQPPTETIVRPLTPAEQERALRDMEQQIPEGQTIVF